MGTKSVPNLREIGDTSHPEAGTPPSRSKTVNHATNADGEPKKAEFVNQFQENLRLQVEAEKEARGATEEETKAADIEDDTPEKSPENSDMVNSAIATHKKRVDYVDGKAKNSTSAVKVSTGCPVSRCLINAIPGSAELRE